MHDRVGVVVDTLMASSVPVLIPASGSFINVYSTL